MPKSRCTQCKKALGVMEYKCKCEKLFCISHLAAEQHACTFDYRAAEQKVIQAIMDSEVKADSFERI
jgi:predicted nucleic acid binding AN1-type Zn finger protein